MYEIDRLPQTIDIGYTGEIDFRTVQIDMSAWVEKMPEGQPTLMHIRPGEYDPYPVTITYENNIITWNVTDGDLGTSEGTGLLQVWFGVQDETEVMRQLGMSAVVATIIHLSLAGEGRNSSTVQIPWLKEVMELKNIILGYDYEAESWANGQRGGEDVGSDDPAYHNNAKYYKEQVESMALDSEAFAAGTRGGEAVDEDDPAYHNNASYYNDQAALEAATAAAAAATASAAYNVNLLAPNYTDLTFPVKKGQPCIYSGGYYEALVDIATTEEWTSAHWKNTKVGAEVNNLKGAFDAESNNVNGQIVDVVALNGEHTNGTSNGVTFAWSQDGKTCHASGTSFANSNGINNVRVLSSIFPPALLNRKPLFYVKSTNPAHLYGQVYWYIGGSIQPERIDLKDGFTEVEIPSTAGGFALRIIADKGGIAYNDDISIRLVLGDSCYISSFGISTIDMKAAIESTLAAFGECHLGVGIFSVSGIEMPEGSTLYGCGDKTEIRLQGTSAGSAIKMASRCTVRDLMITGSNADITLDTTVGNRHGILWQGNYANEYGEGSADRKENQPSNGTIYNVSIKRFTGGGITCDNTGPAVNHGLNVTNVKIENCNAGINVAYYSEFHRFTNVMAYLCQYACVNNGGNNVFVNCGFSNSKVGIITKMVDGSTIIDRTTGNPKTRPTTNNTHGSAIGCVFNHMDRDDVTLGTGDAVHLEATDNGFFFDSCQFFYGSIYLENSKAISFGNCLFGPNKNSQGTTVGYAINLKNTDSTNRKTFFNGCIFSRQPVFTIENTGSGTVAPIINASYTHGGAVITAG